MIRIETFDEAERWVGIVAGRADHPPTPKVKRSMLRLAWQVKQRAGVPLRQVLEDFRNQALRDVEALKDKNISDAEIVRRDYPILMTYKMPKPGKTPTQRHKPDPHGIKQAAAQFIRDSHPSFDYFTASTFVEFTEGFLKCVRGFILDWATHTGMVLIPENYSNKIWTPDFLIQLGSRLRIANTNANAKTEDMLHLKEFLLLNWEPERLHTLDRRELADRVNSMISAKHKPDAVWKTAYRLGLLSSRGPGPKGFQI